MRTLRDVAMALALLAGGVGRAGTWERVEQAEAPTFTIPAPAERAGAAELFAEIGRAAPRGSLPAGAAERARALGLRLEVEGDVVWLADAEARGRGVFALRLGPLPAEIVLQATHPTSDLHTGSLVSALFDAGGFRAAFLATAHRNAVVEPMVAPSWAGPELIGTGTADHSNTPTTIFQAATAGLAEGLLDPTFVQVHGFSAETSAAEAVVSTGRSRGLALEPFIERLREALEIADVRTGQQVPRLAAMGNVQAAMLADQARFLHLELSLPVRKALREDKALRAALADALLDLGRPATLLKGQDPVPLEDALAPMGVLDQGGGEPLLLALEADAPTPEIRDEAGFAVPTRGVPEGVQVTAAPTSRGLTVEGVDAREVKVVARSQSGETAAWEAVRQAIRQQTRGGGEAVVVLPPLPDGAGPLAARLRLRAAALLDPDVIALGTAADLALHAPPSRATTRRLDERAGATTPGAPWSTTVEGPGTAFVATLPQVSAGLARYEVHVTLDGKPWQRTQVASLGVVRMGERVWIPPGRHVLGVRVEELPCQVFVEPRPLRAGVLSRPPGDPRPRTGVDVAERLLWMGDRAAALDAFRPLLGIPGPTGELARARVIELTDDPSELVHLAVLPEQLSADGLEVLVDAVLARAGEIPTLTVLAAVERAASPDLVAVARWMDQIGGFRPRGVALLKAATPDGPSDPTLAREIAREASIGTRYTRLKPVWPVISDDPRAGDASTFVWQLTETGPGLTRTRLLAGESATITLPERVPGRFPVLRLEAPGPVRYRVDGQLYDARRGGILDVALDAGPHALAVEAGELRVLDPEIVEPGQGHPAYAWAAVALPARWELTDPGFAVDLRVQIVGAAPDAEILALFDDGRVERIHLDDEGSAPLMAGPWSQALTLLAPDACAPVLVSVTARTPRRQVAPEPREPPADLEAALVALSELSAEIDAARDPAQPDPLADAGARLQRARLLSDLGQITLARRDLAALLSLVAGPGEEVEMFRLHEEAAQLLENAAPKLPSADRLGALTLEAAFAEAGLDPLPPSETPAEQAAALAAFALQVPSPAPLWAAASEQWLEARDAAQALDAARRAGDLGAEMEARVAAQLRFQALSRAESGAGLVPVRVTPRRATEETSLGRQVTEALLLAPWTVDEAITLRQDSLALATTSGREIVVSLYCRDEAGPGDACGSVVRVDGERRTVQIRDGRAPLPVSFTVSPGSHEIEVSGPGRGKALLVRLETDGALLPPGVARLAMQASPGQPVRLYMDGEAVLRVEALRGQATVEADGRSGVARAGEDPLLLPVPRAGAVEVVVSGDADVLLARGVAGPPPDPARQRRAGTPPSRLSATSTVSVFQRFSTPPPSLIQVPSGAGSTRVRLSATRELLRSPTEPWLAGEVSAAFARSRGPSWLWLEAWSRGPVLAAGGVAELGWRWPTLMASARVWGGSSSGVAGGASSVQGRLDLRGDLALGADLDLRTELRARAAWLSDPAVARVDPRVWTLYRAEHPHALELSSGLVLNRWRDLRAALGVAAATNTPPDAPLDRVGAWADLDLLATRATVLSADLDLDLGLKDQDRAEARWSSLVGLRLDHAPWLSSERRLLLRAGVGLDPLADRPLVEGWSAALSVGLFHSPGRGLSDLPPDFELFQTLREAP